MNYKKKYMGHGMYKKNPFYGQTNISLGADKYKFSEQFGNNTNNIASNVAGLAGSAAGAATGNPLAIAQLAVQGSQMIGNLIPTDEVDPITGMTKKNVATSAVAGLFEAGPIGFITNILEAQKTNRQANLASARMQSEELLDQNLEQDFYNYRGSNAANQMQNPYMPKIDYGANNIKNYGLKNPDKADLNKDGSISEYESKRGKAIERNMGYAGYGKNPYYGNSGLINIERDETIYLPDDSDVGMKVVNKLGPDMQNHMGGGENFLVPNDTVVLNDQSQDAVTEAIQDKNINQLTGEMGRAQMISQNATANNMPFSGDVGAMPASSMMNPFYGQSNLITKKGVDVTKSREFLESMNKLGYSFDSKGNIQAPRYNPYDVMYQQNYQTQQSPKGTPVGGVTPYTNYGAPKGLMTKEESQQMASDLDSTNPYLIEQAKRLNKLDNKMNRKLKPIRNKYKKAFDGLF